MIDMVEIDRKNFEDEVVASREPVLVDFWAPWCMPCKIIAPAIEMLSKELKGRVKVCKLNIDESPELATELSILNIPTLLLFKEGREISRMIGINSKEAIEAKIKTLIG